MNRILRFVLGLAKTVVENVRIEEGCIVVVDHDRGCLIWAHEGWGKEVLNLFLDELTREQRRAIEVVTADGAKWIRKLVKRRCPNARWVMAVFPSYRNTVCPSSVKNSSFEKTFI